MKEETFTLSIDEMPPQSHDPKDYEIWQLKAEIERLTNERDLALSNADGVYARLMPEIERLRAALEKFGSHNANCGYYDHESLKCDCGFTAALSHQQSPHDDRTQDQIAADDDRNEQIDRDEWR